MSLRAAALGDKLLARLDPQTPRTIDDLLPWWERHGVLRVELVRLLRQFVEDGQIERGPDGFVLVTHGRKSPATRPESPPSPSVPPASASPPQPPPAAAPPSPPTVAAPPAPSPSGPVAREVRPTKKTPTPPAVREKTPTPAAVQEKAANPPVVQEKAAIRPVVREKSATSAAVQEKPSTPAETRTKAPAAAPKGSKGRDAAPSQEPPEEPAPTSLSPASTGPETKTLVARVLDELQREPRTCAALLLSFKESNPNTIRGALARLKSAGRVTLDDEGIYRPST